MYKTGMIDIEAVLAVARLGGFRPAATELGISTSSLSSAVAGLEKRLAVRLFNRTTRSVSLTDAGKAFVERVAPSMSNIALAMDEAKSLNGRPAGTLRLNSSIGAARMVLEALLLIYLRRYPDITVNLTTQDRNIDIVAGGFDAGLRLVHAVPLDMIRVPLGSNISMAVVGSPAYFADRPAPSVPLDLLRHECVRARLPSGAAYAWEFARHGETIEIDVPGRLILDAPALMLDAARDGWGLAYVADWYVEEDIRSGRLIRVLKEWTPPFPGLALYYPPGRHVPAALRVLIELIRELTAAPSQVV